MLMEMVRLALSGWDLVDVYVEDTRRGRMKGEPLDAKLLTDLPSSRLLHVLVLRVDVPTRLEPPMKLAMKDERRRSLLRVKDERARGEVPGLKVIPRKRISRSMKMRRSCLRYSCRSLMSMLTSEAGRFQFS